VEPAGSSRARKGHTGRAPALPLSAAFLYSAPVYVGAQTSNPAPSGAGWGSKQPPALAAAAERPCAPLPFIFSDRGLPKVDLDPGQPFADHAG
jgi:hypothetical protein